MKHSFLEERVSLGNAELWQEPKIAFFASRKSSDVEKEKIRCWGRNQAKRGVCIVSAFHSDAEKALLSAILRNGGKAIWVLGKSIPETFSREESLAVDENRLFLISCIHRNRHSLATSRYANHLAAMIADAIVFAHISEKSMLYPFYRELCKKRKNDVTRIK